MRGIEIVLLLSALRPASWWRGALHDIHRRRPRHIFTFAVNIAISAIIIRRRSRDRYHIIVSPPVQFTARGRCLLAERWDAWQRAVGLWDASGHWFRGYQVA